MQASAQYIVATFCYRNPIAKILTRGAAILARRECIASHSSIKENMMFR
jgi:hypothetical protein